MPPVRRSFSELPPTHSCGAAFCGTELFLPFLGLFFFVSVLNRRVHSNVHEVSLHSKVSCKDATKRNPRIMRILFVYGSAVTGPVGQVGELPSSRRHKVSNLLGRWPTQRILREIHHRVNPATKTTATLSSNNKDCSNTVIKLEQNTPMEATTRVPCKKIQNAIKCGFRVNRRAMLFAREKCLMFRHHHHGVLFLYWET